jgi:hypothetical protein
MAAVLAAAVDREHHITAAESCIAHARHLVSIGRPGVARERLKQADECWPPAEAQIKGDDEQAWVYLCP